VKLSVLSIDGVNGGIEPVVYVITGGVFDVAFNDMLVRQVIHSTLTNRKVGTKKQKTRGEVSGGGVKPWKQKHTGRARAGSIRSPLWRSGGCTFAARGLHKCEHKVNKKMRKGALRCVLSEVIRRERVVVFNTFNKGLTKTRDFSNFLNKTLGTRNGVYILVDNVDIDLKRVTSNLVGVYVNCINSIDILKILKCKFLLTTRSTLSSLERFLEC
jgi:large subunit ribosomal protein L4